jgi:hypothetical protein
MMIRMIMTVRIMVCDDGHADGRIEIHVADRNDQNDDLRMMKMVRTI